MQVELDKIESEYYIATVEREQYVWTLGVPDSPGLWTEIDTWCEQTFGEQGMWGGPVSAWKRMGPSYYFQHIQDREMFVLRWS